MGLYLAGVPTMTARPCCCSKPYYNLCKIHPATGAIIWRALVPGNGIGNPNAYRIEPLRGTNDVIVEIGNTGGGTLCRVDSTGVQQWWLSGYGDGSMAGRTFGVSSGGTIVAKYNTGNTVRGLNGSGSTVWTTTFVGTVGGCCAAGSYAIVSERPGITYFNRLTASSGAVAWRLAHSGSIHAIDSSNGFIDLNSGGFAGTVGRYDSNTNALLASAANGDVSASSGGSGYAFGSLNAVRGTLGTSLASNFFLSSVSGASLSGRGGGPNCVDASRYYFGTSQLTGTGGVHFNLYAVTSSGSLVWIQKWGGVGYSGSVHGLCISDDGYLYASGNYIHA